MQGASSRSLAACVHSARVQGRGVHVMGSWGRYAWQLRTRAGRDVRQQVILIIDDITGAGVIAHRQHPPGLRKAMQHDYLMLTSRAGRPRESISWTWCMRTRR